MNDEQARELGEYIRHLRAMHSMTVRALAAHAGVDSTGLSRLEGGKICVPSPNTLCRLAGALDTPVANLFTMAGYATPQDLPDIEYYLRTKYHILPESDRAAITKEIEWLAGLYSLQSISAPGPDAYPENPTASDS